MTTAIHGRVLIVAGSDSGGGAGIQADIKTVTALGGYAMTAITALTAQNTTGVHGIHEVPTDFTRQQIQLVLDDIGADCVKLGMLHSTEVIAAVADELAARAVGVPLVVDPVMVAKGGARLLADDATAALKQHIVPRATILTPNVHEAEALTGLSVTTRDEAAAAAAALLDMGPQAVLLTGGHLDEAAGHVVDLLQMRGGDAEVFSHERIDTPHTHGTGCTLASAIACGLAQGLGLRDAVQRARRYVLEAIRSNPGFGTGHGPLNHVHTVRPFGA